MRKPKAPAPINLPYASTVASFYGDQGAVQGNSFLGKMFRGLGQTRTRTQGQPAPASSSFNSSVIDAIFGMGIGPKTQTQKAPATATGFLNGMMK